MASKIAIFDWGGDTIHSYYLADELSNNGILVDLFIYIPFPKLANFKISTFLPGSINKNLRIIPIKGTYFEDKLMRLNRITQILNHPFPVLYIHLLLPFKTRWVFRSRDYNHIITVSIYSLYWLYKTEPLSLGKLLHYSLEIEKITDPHVKKHWKIYPLLNNELLLLKKAKGLIIQDKLRLNALLNGNGYNLKVFFLPVSIPGAIVESRNNYFHREFGLLPGQKVILYFGALYDERKIDQLIDAFTPIDNPELVLVLHGGNVKFPYLGTSPNIKVSDNRVEYHELHTLMSAATIGIALYDNSWPNTRFTAFSSEKIARYLQAGVPFIAFNNESYEILKNQFDCCELIEDLTWLNAAIVKLLKNYAYYRANCFRAYEKFYDIRNTVKPLRDYLLQYGA